MREPLKDLWDAIIDKNNEDRIIDFISLLNLILQKEIDNNEMQELKEYAKGTIL